MQSSGELIGELLTGIIFELTRMFIKIWISSDENDLNVNPFMGNGFLW